MAAGGFQRTLGETLEDYRNGHNMSRRDLAALLKIRPDILSACLAGKSLPPVPVIMQILDTLRLDPRSIDLDTAYTRFERRTLTVDHYCKRYGNAYAERKHWHLMNRYFNLVAVMVLHKLRLNKVECGLAILPNDAARIKFLVPHDAHLLELTPDRKQLLLSVILVSENRTVWQEVLSEVSLIAACEVMRVPLPIQFLNRIGRVAAGDDVAADEKDNI